MAAPDPVGERPDVAGVAVAGPRPGVEGVDQGGVTATPLCEQTMLC